MTKEEKQEVYNTAVSAASRHGAVLTSLILKCAEDANKPEEKAPVEAPKTEETAAADPKPAEGNYIDAAKGWFGRQDEALENKATSIFGPNMGRYLATGAWGGLGAGILGLLREFTSGKKNRSYWDAFWRHALPGFVGGIGGQYLHNNYYGLDNSRKIVSDSNQAGADAAGS